MRVLVAVIVMLQVAVVRAETPTADAVLAQSADAYRAVRTYRDRGTIVEGDGAQRTFATAFGAPSWLAYRIENPGDRGVWEAWVTRDHTYQRRTVLARPQPIERLDPTGGADLFASARAVSLTLGAGDLVPRLLLGDASPLQLAGTKLVGREMIRARPCWHVEGTGGTFDTHLDLWIEADTHFIRRVRQFLPRATHANGTIVLATTLTYDYDPERDPILDVPSELDPPLATPSTSTP